MKSDKTMTKAVILHKSQFIPYIRRVDLSCSTSHWDQLQRNSNNAEIAKATKQLISVRIFAVLHDLGNK